MKKILLTFAAACAFSAATAAVADLTKVWQSSVENAFEAKDRVFNAPVAIDASGNVIATGAFSQDLTIAGSSLEAIGTSAYIAKYDAKGSALWAVALTGAATVKAVETDAAGNIYLAGVFADVVTFGSTSGEPVEKEGLMLDGAAVDMLNSSFIAKYDADGKLLGVETFIPEPFADLHATGAYFPAKEDIYFCINGIKVSGDKVYASAIFTNQLTKGNAELKAAYNDPWGIGFYTQLPAVCVIALDNNLASCNAVITAHVPENLSLSEEEYKAISATFDVADGAVYAVFSGSGALSLDAAAESKTLDAKFDEYNYIFTEIKDGKIAQLATVACPSAGLNVAYTLTYSKVSNGKLYVVGDEPFAENYGEANERVANEIFVFTADAAALSGAVKKAYEPVNGDITYSEVASAAIVADELYINTLGYYNTSKENEYSKGDFAGVVKSFVFANDEFADSPVAVNAVGIAAAKANVAFSQIGETGVTYSLYNDPNAASGDDLPAFDDNSLTQAWSKAVTGIFKDGKIAYNANVAIDKAGAVIAAGAYNQDAKVEGVDLEAIGTSAYIVKYTAEGTPAWTVGIVGSATVNKITVDADNNIYVAGQYADLVKFGTTSGEAIEKEGMTVDGDPCTEQNGAFIAKYNADGKIANVITFVPEIQPALLPLIDDFEAEPMYWYTDGDVKFTIADLKFANDRLYAGVVYDGITKVGDITLNSSYVNFMDFLMDDNIAAAVISFDANLADAKIVDEIKATKGDGEYVESAFEVWNVRLDISGSDMLVAYTGIGEQNYQGSVIEDILDEGNASSPYFLFSTFKDDNFVAKTVVATASSMINAFNSVTGVKIIGNKGVIAGHKYTNVDEVYTNDLFVADVPGLNVENVEFTTTPVITKEFYQLSTDAAFTANGNVFITTDSYYQTASGKHKKGDLAGAGTTYVFTDRGFATSGFNAVSVAVSDANIAFANIAETGTTFTLYADPSAAGIEDIVIDENAPVEYFNLQGVRVANPENGLYIVRQGKNVTKQIIRK